MSEAALSPALSVVHIARALGWRVEMWDSLRLELAAIEAETALSCEQRQMLREPREDVLRVLSEQLERLSALRAEHVARLSDRDAAAFVLQVASGCVTLPPMTVPPILEGRDDA
jgi:hypothetical protein